MDKIGATTFSIMTLTIVTLSIMDLIETLSITPLGISIKCNLVGVIMLSVVFHLL
jgi:hypothetical protein